MKKEITHQDKLSFYKKFHSEDFIKLYQSLEQRSAGYGFMLTRVISLFAFVCGCFVPWFFLVLIPTELPAIVKEIQNYKQRKKLIESLVEGITYSDFIEMTQNGEWIELGIECSALDSPSVHYIENCNSQIVADIEYKTETTNRNEPSAAFIENIKNFVETHNGKFLDYYTYDSYHETNEIFIAVKTHNGKILEFVVTPNDFVCIFEELDYSSDWKDYLYSHKTENNV